ncbi:hypothetical protein [Fictibacillus fluitans]|uniref:Uncharacterized protein n=1 Tax=Fictibacillus fluitans TaxID=3058422 RepID=A0ABT8HV56_9BACL|nr:hypothetical protein [Fictibacillus sp. NE201]MDN4524668.1 hypothetical protein [Fictibacillus sp. NE201]
MIDFRSKSLAFTGASAYLRRRALSVAGVIAYSSCLFMKTGETPSLSHLSRFSCWSLALSTAINSSKKIFERNAYFQKH